ncbi:zinc-ribbon domain-containing protein [Parafrankia sp. EAN1pec]|uniref:zinc-ribbon domain-containing protein n=1 Tax=Parafrankia sp. (strain EAN1pec) TaxID=298653 RepID=UPI0000543BF1
MAGSPDRADSSRNGSLMLAFGCAYCGQLVFFENSTCLRCGSALGVAPSARRLITLVDAGDGLFRERLAVADEAAALAAEITAPAGAPGAGTPGGDRSVPAEPQQPRYRRCGNMELAGCNWLVELAPGAAGPPPGQLCASRRPPRYGRLRRDRGPVAPAHLRPQRGQPQHGLR